MLSVLNIYTHRLFLSYSYPIRHTHFSHGRDRLGNLPSPFKSLRKVTEEDTGGEAWVIESTLTSTHN